MIEEESEGTAAEAVLRSLNLNEDSEKQKKKLITLEWSPEDVDLSLKGKNVVCLLFLFEVEPGQLLLGSRRTAHLSNTILSHTFRNMSES